MMTRAEFELIPMENLRREVLALHDRYDAALERARVAEAQEMVGVTREMTAIAFVSRDLVARAYEVLGDQDVTIHDAVARASRLLGEALGR